jgi:hypothetical protein
LPCAPPGDKGKGVDDNSGAEIIIVIIDSSNYTSPSKQNSSYYSDHAYGAGYGGGAGIGYGSAVSTTTTTTSSTVSAGGLGGGGGITYNSGLEAGDNTKGYGSGHSASTVYAIKQCLIINLCKGW